MTPRTLFSFGLALTLQFSLAQTVLTAVEYASLKGHEALPEGAIIISGAGTPAGAPAGWLTARGGGGGCGCWIEPDADYTVAMPENDDFSSAQIDLPFTFSLFGDTYTALYINNNGNVSFGDPYGTFTAAGFPSDAYFMVAPFWADVDTRDTTYADTTDYLNGQVLYKVTDHALYVNWVEVGYFNTHGDKRNTFQLILTDGTDPAVPGGNNVSFCYGDMQWTTGDASQGVSGFEGVSATVGVNRGNGTDHAQVGRFSADGATYNGAYTDSSGVHWLDSTHFYLNTMNAGVPPIFGSTFDCDTVIVQMPVDGPDDRDGELHHLFVLPGALDELVSCTSDAPTLPNFLNITQGPEAFLDITFEINADEAEVGIHFITFTAQNNDPEPLTSTYVLQVEKTGNTNTGLTSTLAGAVLQLVPNPAMDAALLSWPTARQVRLIEVIAADGRTLISQRPNDSGRSMTLDLKSLASGSYMVRAFSRDGVFTSRLVRSAY